MTYDIFDAMRRVQRQVDALPPIPNRIIARHDVPSGRVCRFWNTRGRLVLYVNRRDLQSLPRVKPPYDMIGVSDLLAPPFGGIPVVYE